MYLKHWDPDDPSADTYPVDDRPAEFTNAGPDNFGTGAGFFVQGDGPLPTVIIPVDAAGNFVVDYFQVSLQPGDNYCVSATTTPGYHSTNMLAQADMDAFMAGTPEGGLLLPRGDCYISQMLTTRRTLWVELDSMAAPIMPDDGPFHGAGVNPDGGEVGDDDVDPGNLGNASTALLAPEYAKAYVDVAIVPGSIDINDDTAFVHNYSSGPPVSSDVRDTVSESWLWSVQVLNAYEHFEGYDWDPQLENGVLGITYPAFMNPDAPPCYIFSEAIRDVAADPSGAPKPALTIEQRVVLHETLHHFGMYPHNGGPYDNGVLKAGNNIYGADEYNELSDVQIHYIRNMTTRP